MNQVRTLAQQARQNLGGDSRQLIARLKDEMRAYYKIQVKRAKPAFLQGSRGQVSYQEDVLFYDLRLEANPKLLLEVLAHEYAHLVLHGREFMAAPKDLIKGSCFLQTGVSALTRYSRRSKLEVEANAFAAELICPATEVFEFWQTHPGVSLEQLCEIYFASEQLVIQQLAEGLFWRVVGEELAKTSITAPLTEEQREAARRLGVPVLVDAGPGAGKTKTLVGRVDYLVCEKEEDPESLLVLTFSNEAANELRLRIQAQLGTEVEVHTFHTFGRLLLDMAGQHLELRDASAILDERAQEELIHDVLGTVDCDAVFNLRDPYATARQLAEQIGFLKDRLVGPERLAEELSKWQPKRPAEREEKRRGEALLQVYAAYEQRKRELNRLDFADLIWLPYQLLRDGDQALRELVSKKYRWVMVDEYQDVSRATALFLKEICGPENPPWVVGDSRQAIYQFRGAEPDNVDDFLKDFPGGERVCLSVNYRSAGAIIEEANKLAAYLDGKEGSRWTAGRSLEPVGKRPVRLVEANSDFAERRGALETVQSWIDRDNIPLHEIAVLARRNQDVRNIAVLLKSHGIQAVTTGLLTAEGAGGHLAAILSIPDEPVAMSRLVKMLWERTLSVSELNALTRELLHHPSPDDLSPEARATREVAEKLRAGSFSQDGWEMLCNFLFFHSSYLRELLSRDDAESTVEVEEVVSSLAFALQYRAAHPRQTPLQSRRGLATRLREVCTQSAPGLVPPRPRPGAVRVMTCHASKGLEFPCVVVVGQTLPQIPKSPEMLPPALRARPYEEKQADSLLFVAATRAQRALVVSYALSPEGKQNSRPRPTPPLLEYWKTTLPLEHWHVPLEELGPFRFGRVWGGASPKEFSLYSLSPESCMLKSYLEDQLNVSFPTGGRPLYPDFMRRSRKMLERALELARVGGPECLHRTTLDLIHEEEWPPEEHADHPHYALYRPRARKWLSRMAQNYPKNLSGNVTLEDRLEIQDTRGTAHQVPLRTVAHFYGPHQLRVAIVLLVGDFDSETINWSELKHHERLGWVLLEDKFGNVAPFVLDASSGKLRQFNWNSRKKNVVPLPVLAANAKEKLAALDQGQFAVESNQWRCDRCKVRIVCPLWMGAAELPETPAKKEVVGLKQLVNVSDLAKSVLKRPLPRSSAV